MNETSGSTIENTDSSTETPLDHHPEVTESVEQAQAAANAGYELRDSADRREKALPGISSYDVRETEIAEIKSLRALANTQEDIAELDVYNNEFQKRKKSLPIARKVLGLVGYRKKNDQLIEEQLRDEGFRKPESFS